MASQSAATTGGDMVRVKALRKILIGRDFEEAPDGTRIASHDRHAEPGDVFELPRAEALKLAGRKFEGYETTRDKAWVDGNSGGSFVSGKEPARGGVLDPQVEILSP